MSDNKVPDISELHGDLVLRDMQNKIDEQMAEAATGCYANPRGIGKYYANNGAEINPSEARQELWAGRSVEIPSAGAGSYCKVFESLGFTECVVWEWSSSAGDWTFMVYDGAYWNLAFQRNRHPRCGFEYSVDQWAFDSKKDIEAYMASEH